MWEIMYLCEEVRVADDDQEGLCSADGNVEPLGVAKETKVVVMIKPQQVLAGTNLQTPATEFHTTDT